MYYQLTKIGRYVEKIQVKLMMRYGMKSYQPDPFGLIDNKFVDRDIDGTIEKWCLIKKYLPEEPYTALDVGCNIGFFSFKMAQHNADHVFGIDIERGPLLVAEKLKLLSRVGNVGFCTLSVGSHNVELLGCYDVILFLSVFHHLVYKYDLNTAKDILRQILLKTRKILFFETGQGDQGFGKMAGSMPKVKTKDAERFCTDLLFECGAVSVEKIGVTALKNGATRYLFKVIPPSFGCNRT